MFVTYERGTRMLFSAAKRVLYPRGVEGVSFSSPDHKQMLSSLGEKGAFPSSSARQVQVEQQSNGKGKGKKKIQRKDLSDEQERDFNLVDHEETQQHLIHQGVGVIDLKTEDPKTAKDMIIK